MEKLKIRLLKAEEIECRINTISEKGVSLLLFKDARVDQKILDETFTPMGWKRTHQFINNSLYCTVEIWDEEKKQWIAKQDVGTMSYSEKEKGQASDSFKRACFNWGVGRELYTAPFIWVPSSRVEIQRKGDKLCCYERFQVQKIGYDGEQRICELTITGADGRVLYALQKKEEPEPEQTPALSQEEMNVFERELRRTGVALEAVLNRYRIKNTSEMTGEIYKKALRDLKKSKNKNAA